jgi:hypothetical protein
VNTDFKEALEKQLVAPMQLRTAVSITAGGFRKICENCIAFFKR